MYLTSLSIRKIKKNNKSQKSAKANHKVMTMPNSDSNGERDK